MFSLRRIIASVAVIAAAAVGLVTAGTAPATADTVTSRWACGGPSGSSPSRDFRITVTAPATVTRGQTATLTASIFQTVNYGRQAAAGTIRGRLEIVVGGAGSGLIYANDLANPDIQPDQPLGLVGGHVDYTFTASGNVTFRPQRILFLSSAGNVTEMCGGTTPVAATTHVS